MPRDNKMTSLNAERKQLTQNSILTKKLLSKMKNKDFFEGKKHGRRNHQQICSMRYFKGTCLGKRNVILERNQELHKEMNTRNGKNEGEYKIF